MTTLTVEAAAALLGVPASATPADVDAAWKIRARLMHPDRQPDGSKAQLEAQEMMKQLNEARDILTGKLKPADPPKPKPEPEPQPRPGPAPTRDVPPSKSPSAAAAPVHDPQAELRARLDTLNYQWNYAVDHRRTQVYWTAAAVPVVALGFGLTLWLTPPWIGLIPMLGAGWFFTWSWRRVQSWHALCLEVKAEIRAFGVKPVRARAKKKPRPGWRGLFGKK